MRLTPLKTQVIETVAIEESPLSIECRVKEIIPLGSHHLFIAEVVNILADNRYLDPATGTFHLSQASLIAYNHGHYYKLGEAIGKFGWTVKKKKK
jgi:flavin reductase (DIM6/NTAB) family NADH-FMN oxidoreductase RutF